MSKPEKRKLNKGKEKMIENMFDEEDEGDSTLGFDFNNLVSGIDTDLIAEVQQMEAEDGLDVNNNEEEEEEDIDEWLEENEFVDDTELNDLLNMSTEEKRSRLKTGGIEELQQDMEEFDANLALTANIGTGKIKAATKRRITAGELRLSPEVKRQLGEANALYIARDYGNAIDKLQAIIQENPNAHPAWNTLGLVHEELGNTAKALQFRMFAAHLCNDAGLWKELAHKSIENDAVKQAVYCFSKVLALDPNDLDALWDRAFLFKQMGRSSDAIDGFLEILKHIPHHFKVINELARLYRQQGKTKEAIKMYEDAIDYHIKMEQERMEEEEDEEEEDDEEDEFSDKLGYVELNMLSELYLILNDYRKALETIKNGLRHIQKRQHETWWLDHVDDDDEYFENDEARTEFPIELRVRMGICRIYLNQVDLGTKHFNYLLQYPPTTYPDLHQDIAYTYYDKRYFDLALAIFQKIIDVSDEVDIDILIKTADCYRELGDLETAVIFYINVLNEQPENLDIMMSLAAIYEEQGKEEEALELVDFVMKKNREARKQKKMEAHKNTEDDDEEATMEGSTQTKKKKNKKASLFDEHEAIKTQKEQARQRKAEKSRKEEELAFSTLGIFNKLDELEEQIGDTIVDADRALIRDYIRNAQQLWEDFSRTGAFYPHSRSIRYKGFYELRNNRSNKQDPARLGLEAHEMAERLRTKVVKDEPQEKTLADAMRTDVIDVDAITEEEDKRLREEQKELERRMRAASQFRNIPFDRWVTMIIKYAYALTISRRVEEAYEMLKRAIDANVFYHDVPKKTALYLVMIGIGLLSGKDYITQDGVRWMCNFYQFRNDPFRMYSAIMNHANQLLVNAQLKFLNRVIRLMDALVSSRQREERGVDETQMKKEIEELNNAILSMDVDPSTANEKSYTRFYHTPSYIDTQRVRSMGIASPEKVNPVLLSLFAQIMSMTRNHVAASLYYMRAYAEAPNDRLITLSLGISLLLVSTHRKTDNRHLNIMQGMMFISEYLKISRSNEIYLQESEYNFARAFHLLGLTHLAVPHYERVLCLPSKAQTESAGPNKRKEKPIDKVYDWPISKEEEAELEEDIDDETDLKSEAAYNLHLIYITSGSTSLAQILLMKYCSV
ncbi:hypothetical protein BDF20DRAFT_834618 [Mycotypha africana]|uniref:uncharacterized protein n=1 Tax=Mycotypha africana TaxID=64632 RepID=UPI0023005DF8|nr:uncharacterized protein BDF20DRAFT_834618 [Mycotypha africana]KAI8981952.1 hypothetical protein BDF20DRAFT_834618 [Mycotypha africana]